MRESSVTLPVTVRVQEVTPELRDQLGIGRDISLPKECGHCASVELDVLVEHIERDDVVVLCQACQSVWTREEGYELECYLARHVKDVAVQEGSEKSLLNVFHDPVTSKMLAIDSTSSDFIIASPYGEHYLLLATVRDEQPFPGELDSTNYVGLLGEWCQQRKIKMPEYEFQTTGPSHQPTITAKVGLVFRGQTYMAVATAGNKKDAKQKAASEVYKKLRPNG